MLPRMSAHFSGKRIKAVAPDRAALALWAADCAEHVLPFFEQQHPEDDRPREAIETARAWARGEIACGKARTAAAATHAAARDSDHAAAHAAARSAGHAAGTAHMAGHARHAAAYAFKAAAAANPSAADTEREWQHRRLTKHLRAFALPPEQPRRTTSKHAKPAPSA